MELAASREAASAPEPLPRRPLPPARKSSSRRRCSSARKKKKEKKEAPRSPSRRRATCSGSLDRPPRRPRGEGEGASTRDGAHARPPSVIVATLRQHGVDGVIRHIRPGPGGDALRVLPVAGVKLARIENLDKELTMALSAIRIRIIAPIPGKGVVGIEVPNRDRATVYLRDILESEAFATAGGFLPLGARQEHRGHPVLRGSPADASPPHRRHHRLRQVGRPQHHDRSMLYRQTPAEVRMIMVDPKMTELSAVRGHPAPAPAGRDRSAEGGARAPVGGRRDGAAHPDPRRHRLEGPEDLQRQGREAPRRGAHVRGPDASPHRKLVVVDVAAGETEEEAAARAAAARPRQRRRPSRSRRPRVRGPDRAAAGRSGRRARRAGSCRRSCRTSSSSSTSSPTS